MSESWCPPPEPSPRHPELALPPRATDSHCHIFGPAAVFPFAPDAPFRPPDAPLGALANLHRTLGFERAVIVQSACHGSDHRVLLDALHAGEGRYRGVALVAPGTRAAELTELAEAGSCGLRLHFMSHVGPAPDAALIRSFAALAGELSWHLGVHVAGDGLLGMAPLLRELEVPIVIDHLARVDLAQGLETAVIAELASLLELGHVWLKLSAAYRISLEGPPYRDGVELARRLAAHAPSRVVWGTDFPHPNIIGAPPDDALQVESLSEIAPDPAARYALLVENPTELFGFK
jgi:2-pyrone-4,6-dicarboxylate lactonase